MSGRIDLTELRAIVEADGYPTAQDVLALVEAVEAAHALEVSDTSLVAAQLEAGTPSEIMSLQGGYGKAMYALGEALARFDFPPVGGGNE